MLKNLSVIIFLSAGGTAIAQSGSEEITYLSCHVCHDSAGSGSAIPEIGGMPYQEILEKLSGFRAASEDSTIMHRFVAGFSEDEMKNMARYISSLESGSQ